MLAKQNGFAIKIVVIAKLLLIYSLLMADYADQHFLPKSYLKNFASDFERKNIGIYVPSKRKYIKSGGIRKQCRRLHFYGEDGVTEKKLGLLETGFQRLLLKIIANNSLPEKNSPDFQEMLFMWLLTSFRNPNKSEMLRSHCQSINGLSEINPNDPRKSRFDLEFDFVGLTLILSKHMMAMTQDLHAVLLVNKNPIPLITSDNPVIGYNQLAEKNGITSAATGTGSIGLQSFFPISPELSIMFYDPSIYKLSGNRDVAIEINNRDVFSLNLLHFLNNLETIYFNEKMSEKEITRLHEASIGYDKGGFTGSKILYTERSDNSLDPYSGIYSTPTSFAAIDLHLSFLNITEFGKSFPVKSQKVLIRDSWRDGIKQFSPERQAEMIRTYNAIQNSRSAD